MTDPRVQWSDSTSFTVTSNATYTALTIPPLAGLSASAVILVHVTYNAHPYGGVGMTTRASPSWIPRRSRWRGLTPQIPDQGGVFWASSSKFDQGGTLAIIATGWTSQGPLAVSALIADGVFYGSATPQFMGGTFHGDGTTISFRADTGTADSPAPTPWASGDLAVVPSGCSNRPGGTPLTLSTSPAGDTNWTVEQNRVSAVASNGSIDTAVNSALLTFSGTSATSAAVVAAPGEPIWMVGFTLKLSPTVTPLAVHSQLVTILG